MIGVTVYEPKKIGGWLYLVGFGLIRSAIISIITILNSYIIPLIDLDLSNITFAFSLLGIGPIEIIWTLIMCAAQVILIYLFFKKSKKFPKVFSGLAVIFAISHLYSYVSLVSNQGPVDLSREAIGAFIQVIIWIPYMFKSQRVRETFVL